VWAPDGRRVLFRSLLDGQPQLVSRAAGTPGAEVEPVFRSTTDTVPTDWRGTGTASEVLFHAPGARGDTDLFLLDRPSRTVRTIAGSGFNESDGRWSPDLRWLAYVSDEFGQPDVFVQRWPAGGRVRVTAAGGLKPRWGAEPRTLYFLRGDAIARVAVSEGDAPSVSAPADIARVPGIRDFDAAHRSPRLLAILPSSGARPVEARALVDWQTAVP
jgi:Tol biopolymer transport system component